MISYNYNKSSTQTTELSTLPRGKKGPVGFFPHASKQTNTLFSNLAHIFHPLFTTICVKDNHFSLISFSVYVTTGWDRQTDGHNKNGMGGGTGFSYEVIVFFIYRLESPRGKKKKRGAAAGRLLNIDCDDTINHSHTFVAFAKIAIRIVFFRMMRRREERKQKQE